MAFENMLSILIRPAVVEFLLPFLFVFVIVYAVLQKTKILGEGKKQFNVVLALLMGLAFVLPHFTGWYHTWDPVVVLLDALPQVSVIVVAIIMVLLIIGVFGNEIDIAGTSLSFWVIILAIVSVVLIFGSAIGWFMLPWWLGFLSNPELQALIVMILVFGIIIWFITKEEKKGEEVRGLGRLVEDWGKVIKKKSEK
ncbi:hypothetical protein AYK26_01685 [Euryarchaeota archaeon SM23-78]|nr:MAG: hypothetical protein AYK26_01685 [Euryarchaeota archaeon SM23-78]MBW3000490.1 hypothetical protein [Candidatus Woesearchaeota archaeon]